jgi:serine/threonine protein kinase
MHCPKCGQTYPEGSQRFCDVEGARLLSGLEGGQGRRGQGVFSTILPISDPRPKRHDGAGSEVRSLLFAPEDGRSGEPGSDLFFETADDEEIQFTVDAKHDREAEGARQDQPVLGRRIYPEDIPAGYVELGRGRNPEHPSYADDPAYNLDDPDTFIGHKVKGRYRVIEFIGEDDTGFAFLAEDSIAEDKRVVVRILADEDLDEVTESIFAEERISLSHLNHPNVVRVIDSGQFVDGRTFLISETLESLSVEEILQIHGALSSRRVARMIRQAGNGLSGVHNEGILHRDLRPSDLILAHADGDAEMIKLSGFGVSDGRPNSQNFRYKAPEILDGRIPTIASDIYSLGVIAFQMLTGRLPFDGRTPGELLRSERAGLKTSPSALRRDLIPAVDYVFEKALAPDPLLRFATAREFGNALYMALTAVPEIEGGSHDPERSSFLDPVVVTDPKPADHHGAEPAVTDEEIRTSGEPSSDEPAWTRRSPEPLNEPRHDWIRIVVLGFAALLVIAAGIWYYILNRTVEPDAIVPPETVLQPEQAEPAAHGPDGSLQIDVPPPPRKIPQPPDTEFFQNNQEKLKGDVLRNFVGFSLYYPKNWKVTGPQERSTPNGRGKFIDLARNTPDGKLQEQMLVGYYPSTGTFRSDSPAFARLAKETNETLKKLIANYQTVSEGNTVVNGGWQAYEVKFQGSVDGGGGERLLVWGRRLFIPSGRPGVRAGFEVTMLATSYAEDIHSVDDVGTRGELASILYTFEPSQNF